jgi:hypothetical protein
MFCQSAKVVSKGSSFKKSQANRVEAERIGLGNVEDSGERVRRPLFIRCSTTTQV